MRALRGSLWRIGAHLRHADQHRWGGPRAVAQCLGALLVGIGLAAMVVEADYTALRQERSDAITPVIAQSDADTQVLYRFGGFASIDNRPVTVVVIAPVSEDSPLPPGVEAWPEPGEVVVSPALAEDLVGDRADLFGPVAGTIGPEGLEVPRERRVYMRPTAGALDEASMTGVSGFGGDNPTGSFYGEGYLNASPQSMVQALLVGTLFLPGVVALVVGSGIHGEERIRQSRTLMALGLQRRHLAAIDAVEGLPAVLVGTALGALLVGAACLADISIPALDAAFPAADTRHAGIWLPFSVLVTLVVAMGTVVASRLSQRQLGTRRTHPRKVERLHVRALFCVVAIVTTIWATANMTETYPRTFAYLAGVVVVALTIPGLVSIVVSVLGSLATRLGLRSGSAGTLVGGRQLERLTQRSARMAIGVCFAALAAGQVQLWSTTFGAEYFHAVQQTKTYGTTVLQASGRDVPERSILALLDSLPEGADPAWITYSESDDPAAPAEATLHVTCDTLTAIELSCASGHIEVNAMTSLVAQQLGAYSLDGSITIEPLTSGTPADSAADTTQMFIVSTTGANLNTESLQRSANRVAPGLQIDTPQQSWISGGSRLVLTSHWIITFAAVGLVGIFGALCASVVADGASTARALAPVGALTGSSGLSAVAATWRTAVPVLASGIIAAIAYYLLPTGLRVDGDALDGVTYYEPSATYVLVAVCIAALSALLASVVARRGARRATRSWRP